MAKEKTTTSTHSDPVETASTVSDQPVEGHAAHADEHGMVETVAHTEHPAAGDHGDAHHGGSPMDVSGEMFAWTLGTFLVMGYLLTKLAWRPILEGLDEREKGIRESVENAEKIREELASIDAQRTSIISEADGKAKNIVERGRRAGKEAEQVIKDKAKEEASILLENADRQIRTARDKAEADLRRDSVDMALALTGRLIGETMDDERQRALTDKLIGEISSK